MKYQCALLAVKDVHRSLAFYQHWFGLEVEVDLGWNIGLKGGLALQEHFAELLELPEDSVVEKSHNMELYFDCEELDTVADAMAKDSTIEWVHPVREYPWKQRVFRIYDPDHHILEVGESMPHVFRRLAAQGHSMEEIATLTQHPIGYVQFSLGENG